jgi:nitrate reductase delta subunit
MSRAGANVVYGCASVLLSYPEASFVEDVAAVASALPGVGRGRVRVRLAEVCRWLSARSLDEAQASYVEAFDFQGKRSLHLTYIRHGDTRERGLALAALTDVYRTAGFPLAPGELPDFLPALLELAAVSPAGVAVLSAERAALDALREGLGAIDSPYGEVVAAVAEMLGPPSRSQRQLLRRYRSEGPPTEAVGLEAFAPPEVVTGGVTRR